MKSQKGDSMEPPESVTSMYVCMFVLTEIAFTKVVGAECLSPENHSRTASKDWFLRGTCNTQVLLQTCVRVHVVNGLAVHFTMHLCTMLLIHTQNSNFQHCNVPY